jgi:hypothetical protein
MTAERGTALIGTLIIGFAVLLIVGQSLVTIGRLSSAATTAEESARFAATWAARVGDAGDASRIAEDLAPGARVEAWETSEGIAVVVSLDVSLVGPDGSPLSTTITGRAIVRISDYRSRR